MNALRETVHTNNNRITIEIPSAFVGKDVEVIVFPATKTVESSSENSLIDELLVSPVALKEFTPFSREQSHER